jgi:hypothetical protein
LDYSELSKNGLGAFPLIAYKLSSNEGEAVLI